MPLKILFAVPNRWFDSLLSWLPSCRAHFSILIRELECLDETKSLVNRAPHREIIDGDLAQILFRVDDEKTSKGNSGIFL